MPYLTTVISGGLGNVLFQLCGCLGLSKQKDIKFFIDTTQLKPTPHSKLPYFELFLRKWKKYHRTITPTIVFYEQYLQPLPDFTVNSKDIGYIYGNLQNYKYFWDYRAEIIELFDFDTRIADSYPKLRESAFLHVRGGDYKLCDLFNKTLASYYIEAIKRTNAPHYYVFTNDKEYLLQQSWLSDINYTLVEENEIDSLYLMSQCQRGAICANSTFSWWGAFLNIDRPVYMPSKWFTDDRFYTEGFFFPGVNVIEC